MVVLLMVVVLVVLMLVLGRLKAILAVLSDVFQVKLVSIQLLDDLRVTMMLCLLNLYQHLL
jgi:hypothetical protein